MSDTQKGHIFNFFFTFDISFYICAHRKKEKSQEQMDSIIINANCV